jgi:hypothetical protein
MRWVMGQGSARHPPFPYHDPVVAWLGDQEPTRRLVLGGQGGMVGAGGPSGILAIMAQILDPLFEAGQLALGQGDEVLCMCLGLDVQYGFFFSWMSG